MRRGLFAAGFTDPQPPSICAAKPSATHADEDAHRNARSSRRMRSSTHARPLFASSCGAGGSCCMGSMQPRCACAARRLGALERQRQAVAAAAAPPPLWTQGQPAAAVAKARPTARDAAPGGCNQMTARRDKSHDRLPAELQECLAGGESSISPPQRAARHRKASKGAVSAATIFRRLLQRSDRSIALVQAASNTAFAASEVRACCAASCCSFVLLLRATASAPAHNVSCLAPSRVLNSARLQAAAASRAGGCAQLTAAATAMAPPSAGGQQRGLAGWMGGRKQQLQQPLPRGDTGSKQDQHWGEDAAMRTSLWSPDIAAAMGYGKG